MDVGKNRKVQKSSLNGIFSLKKNTYIPAMHKKTKDSVFLNTSLNNDAKILNNELVKIKGEQGLIGNLWDGFKNLTKVGAGSQKVEKAIKDLNNGKLTNEEAQQILENYKDGQKTCVDVVADMISSIVSVGAFVAAVPSGGASLPVGLAISTALSTGLKVGIKGIDAKSNGREYNSKNLLYDVVTGSVNGLLAPVTNGFGSSLTKTIGCKLGLEITGDVLETGAKNTLKNLIVNQSIDVAGGTVKQRALALGAGMAIDGALGGAADNTVREFVEDKDDKNVFKAAIEGFFGGLIMAPIVGGGFRIASKLGSKIGNKISFKSNNVSDIPNNPFSQGLDRKQIVEQPPLINSDNDMLFELNPIVQQTTEANVHFTGETNIIPGDELVYIEEVPSIPISRTIDVDDSVSQAAKVDETGTKEIAASSVKSDSILDSEVKSEPEIKNVLTPEEIVQRTTIKKLKDSLENIPTDVIKKKEFIKEFLLTNLKTGKQLEITPNSFFEKSFNDSINSLLALNSSDVPLVLESWLDVSILQNRDNIYCSSIYDPNKFIKTCKKCKQRNVFNLYQEMKNNQASRMIGQPSDFFKFGEMSDNDFNKTLTLAQHLKTTNKDFLLYTLPEFVIKTNKDSIHYMINNDLFNLQNHYSVDRVHEIFSRLQGIDVESLTKIHQRGLLNQITEEKIYIPIQDAKVYASQLSDVEWQSTLDRNLFLLKTNTNKKLNRSKIINFAKLDDEVFNRLHSRKLLDKVGNNLFILDELLLLSDEEWQKVLDRNVRIDELSFSAKEVIDLPEDKWQVAQKRGIDFSHEDDFTLLELSDAQWDNITKRNLDAMKGYRKVYDLESQIKLSKLTDEEFELAKKRNLIKGVERKYNEQAFSEESEFLLKCTDEQFSLYIQRKIGCIETSFDKKKDLFLMTDEQFARVQNDIIPIDKKYIQRHSKDKLSDLYKLAYLYENEYKDAICFVGIEHLKQEQFTYDEIIQILSLPQSKKQLLSDLLMPTDSANRVNYKKVTLLKLMQYTDEQYKVVCSAARLLSAVHLNEYILNDEILSRSFLQNLEQNSTLISKINNSDLSIGAQKELLDTLLGVQKQDYSQLSLREKIKKISLFQEAQNSSVFEKEESNFLNIDDEIIKLQDSVKHVVQTTDVSKSQIKNMFTKFFANDNPELFDLLTSTDFSKFGKSGLPLEYSRTDFLKDLSVALKQFDEESRSVILDKLGISILEKDGVISGYNGFINLNKLSNDGPESEILALATKFIKENKVKTDDEELNIVLNSLIDGMPEFINIIGKQQHANQDYSLDIHSLQVLKNILENPDYQNLNNEDKFCLKIAAILHDIAKADSVLDKEHEQLCSLYAKDILTKDNMMLSKDLVNRVFDLIQNHNWLERLSMETDSPTDLAVKFRRKNDHRISQIFTEADLKSVKSDDEFYRKHSHMLADDVQKQIVDALHEINKKGHIFLTNKIIDKSKIPTVTKNGKTYKVVDFSKMVSGTDLSQYGFEPGTTYDNLRLFIHAVNDGRLSNILNVINLSDPNYQGFLCASFASLSDSRTYGDNKFGVSLESLNINIANAAVQNQASGGGKNFERFSKVLSGVDKTSKYRDLIPAYIKESLKLSDEEYSELFTQIQRIKYSSQLENIKKIQIGEKSFSGKEIKDVILNANDQLIQDLSVHHNELNLYTPRTNAIFAKVDSFDEIPDELLNIAEMSDLPIYILGSEET